MPRGYNIRATELLDVEECNWVMRQLTTEERQCCNLAYLHHWRLTAWYQDYYYASPAGRGWPQWMCMARADYDLGVVWAEEPGWCWSVRVNTRRYLGDLFGWVPIEGVGEVASGIDRLNIFNRTTARPLSTLFGLEEDPPI